MFGGLRRAGAVAAAAMAEERKRPKVQRNRNEREFLPAAVEVLETPASPVGRAVALLLVSLFLIALAWSYFGHIDTVATAQGKVIPGDRVKLVQPLEIGKVRAIHVEEGSRVQAGDLLLELDPTEMGADRDRILRDLESARVDIARLQALLAQPENPLSAFEAPPAMRPDLVIASQAQMVSQSRAHVEELGQLQSEMEKRSAELAVIDATVAMLEEMIPLLAERVSTQESLSSRRIGTRSAYLQLKQELVEQRGELAIQKSRRGEVTAAIRTLERRRAERAAAFKAEHSEGLAEALRQAAALEQELVKAEQRYRQRRLIAPVSGTVQQLQVHTVGGVVTPADPVMVIVPEDSTLEIEAMVLNKDVGFVAEGQAVEIKVESFPYTKYGLLTGEVADLSADAVQDEAQGLVYPARIQLAEAEILVGERWVPITPGMSVTAEVKTGQRRLIEYFISPFLEYQDEALRER